MEKVQETFEMKLSYIIKMVYICGVFQVPKDWWSYAYAETETDKFGRHREGTVFKIIQLNKKFEFDYNKRLKEANIIVKNLRNGIIYEKA